MTGSAAVALERRPVRVSGTGRQATRASSGPRLARIAYLLTVHKNADQVARLLAMLQHPDDLFVLHADRKSPAEFRRRIDEMAAGARNVSVLPSRPIAWGGWSQCAVELDAIRLLLARPDPWTYFVNLSGQDLPLHSRDLVAAELATRSELNYIGIRPLERMPAHVRRRLWCFSVELAGRAFRVPLPWTRRASPPIAWKGSSWHILTRDFCAWLTEAPTAAACIANLRRVALPDEFLMQTLIMNSPFADTVAPDYRRAIAWREGEPSPRTLTMADWPWLQRSDAWFARKFDPHVDSEVIVRLAERFTAEQQRGSPAYLASPRAHRGDGFAKQSMEGR